MSNNKQQDTKYGVLLHPSIKLHRKYFHEMVKLLGIYVYYIPAKPESKHYTTYGELVADYNNAIKIGVIFDEHPTQQTLKKMGWVSELQENSSIIHVDYDLPGLQQGAMFVIPSGIDKATGRLFRLVRITNSIVYPASVSCEIVPEYLDNFLPESGYDYERTSFNLLNREDEVETDYHIYEK